MEALSVVRVESLAGYIDAIVEINSDATKGSLYRGQPDYKFGLTSTLQRCLAIPGRPAAFLNAQKAWHIFRKERHLYHSSGELAVWDELALAQHYGMPTRLLDWTLDPLIGLYFALESIPDGAVHTDACVYVIPAMGEVSWVDSSALGQDVFAELDIKNMPYENYIIVPDYKEIRVRSQSGVFSITKSVFSEFPKRLTHHVVLSAGAIPRLKNELIMFNVTKKRVYLDVASLCADLKATHF